MASGEQTGAGRASAIVYNPVKITEAKLDAVERVAIAAGWAPPKRYETTVEDPGLGVATQAIDDGAELVVAAGGDGTVRSVADALRGSGVPLGLLPSGTGNLLARNLKLPILSTEAAARAAFGENERVIDVGVLQYGDGEADELSEAGFLVMAGIGLDAEMFVETNDDLKKRVGWLAYVDGGLRAVRKSRRKQFRYRLDDGITKTVTAHSILIGNCGLLPGNLLLLPDAEVDDGILDVVALRAEGIRGWWQLVFTVVWKNGVLRRAGVGKKFASDAGSVRTLLSMRGRRLSLRSERAIPFQIDGDLAGEATRVIATVDHESLIVRVP